MGKQGNIELNKAIISVVEKYDVIYTPRRTSGTESTFCMDNVWVTVTKELNDVLGQNLFKWKELREKWSLLKKCYVRGVKKDLEFKRANGVEKLQHSYYLNNEMEFLRPYINLKPNTRNRPVRSVICKKKSYNNCHTSLILLPNSGESIKITPNVTLSAKPRVIPKMQIKSVKSLNPLGSIRIKTEVAEASTSTTFITPDQPKPVERQDKAAILPTNTPNDDSSSDAEDCEGFKNIETYSEALKCLKSLDEFALMQSDYRAIGLINQLENHFKIKKNN